MLTSKRVNLVQVQWGIKSTAPCGIRHDSALNPSGVPRLGRQNGSGGFKVGGVGDVLSSAEVGRCTYTFEDSRESGKCLGVGIWERVIAWLGSSRAQSAGEEGDMLCLMVRNLLEAFAHPGSEAGAFESSGIVGSKSSRVCEARQGALC